MASALETLAGQSYGAGQHHMLGVHTQRAMWVLTAASVPLAAVWASTEAILAGVGQDSEIAAEAGRYVRLMLPSLFAYGLLQCLVRFLQTQSIVFPPPVLSSAATTLLHVLLCWGLVVKSGLGAAGAALDNAVSFWVNVLLVFLYVVLSPSCTHTWTGFSAQALVGALAFLRLAVPSAIMVW